MNERRSSPSPDARLVVSQSAGDGLLQWSYRWMNPPWIFVVVWCAFWDGSLLFWYHAALSHPPANGNNTMLWFPLPHVGVGLVVAYAAAAGLLNRTFVTAGNDEIRVRHGPLAWPGALRIAAHDIAQLFVEAPPNAQWPASRRMIFGYKLCAVLRDGHKKMVTTTLPTIEVAQALERALERHLGIDDRSVPGEADR